MADLGALPPTATPMTPVSSFPILAISLIGMLSTTILLIGYYLVVLKCCLNWRRSDDLSHLTDSQFRRLIIHVDQLHEQQGLDEKLIRAIPTVRFDPKTHLLQGCAICLSDFRDGEALRRIPTCSHHFHVDCIDIWLQNSGNCPICRSEISAVIEEGFLEEKRGETKKGGSKGDEFIDLRRGRREEEASVVQVRRSMSMDSLFMEERRDQKPLLLLGGSSRSSEIPIRH